MASSLRFVISSAFNAVGFDQATKSFSSLAKGAAVATAGLAKLALTGKGLGVTAFIFVALQALRAAKAIGQMVPDAAAAEVSINRLKIQLDLLGQGAQENIERINTFARGTAAATRFTADEVRAAVTESVRRTGDLEGSIRRVAVAQDIAAVTGQSLQRTIRQLALAEQGRVRSLQLITDLSRQELVTAARRGEILDVLEQRFRGAAEAEADTLQGLRTRLDSVNRDTRRQLGNLALPFRRFGAQVELIFAQAGNAITNFLISGFRGERDLAVLRTLGRIPEVLQNITQVALRSGDAITAFRQGFSELVAGAPDLGGGRTRATDEEISEEAEFLTARLGRSADERRQIAREFARINELLRLAEQDVTLLNEEQVNALRAREFSSRRLNEAIITQAEERVEAELAANNKLRQAQSQAPTFDHTGNTGGSAIRQERDELVRVLRENQVTEAEIRRILAEQDNVRRQTFKDATTAARIIAQSQRNFLEELNSLGVRDQGIFEEAFNRLQSVTENISAAVTPSVNVNFNIQPEVLRGNIFAIAEQTVRNFLSRLGSRSRNDQRQQDINSSLE